MEELAGFLCPLFVGLIECPLPSKQPGGNASEEEASGHAVPELKEISETQTYTFPYI